MTIAFSLPTGVGADIGGYAGDVGAIVREFSKFFRVVVNPNAVNAGIFSAINENMLYVEGFAFDEFLCSRLNLVPVQKPNKIGVVFDCAIPENILNVHINTLNALKIVKGYDILEPVYTKNPTGVNFSVANGISSGSLNDTQTLLEAANTAVKNGAEVLCIVCYFGDDADDENYSCGAGIDPIGGVEAVISHLIVKELNVPAAHAPAFFDIDISTRLENPKVASECVSSTYLPCVIEGLQFAPKFEKTAFGNCIKSSDIKYLIVPDGAMGSKGVLGAYKNGIKICAVKNSSKLDVGFKKLGLSDILEFDNYAQCLEYIKE